MIWIMHNHKNLPFFLFFILAGFWGGSFVAIKIIVESIPPVFGAACRVGLALMILTIIYKCFNKPFKVPRVHLKKVWMIGLFMQGIPFSLLSYGDLRGC